MVHIGSLIKEQLEIKGWAVSAFAKKINTNRNNVYHIFTRTSIDTELLQKIGNVLDHDFFQYFNTSREKPKENSLNKEWLNKEFIVINLKLDKILRSTKK